MINPFTPADLSSPSTPGGTGMSATSLFRETDIKPSMKDLDNIFDTDEDDNDDAVSSSYDE